MVCLLCVPFKINCLLEEYRSSRLGVGWGFTTCRLKNLNVTRCYTGSHTDWALVGTIMSLLVSWEVRNFLICQVTSSFSRRTLLLHWITYLCKFYVCLCVQIIHAMKKNGYVSLVDDNFKLSKKDHTVLYPEDENSRKLPSILPSSSKV